MTVRSHRYSDPKFASADLCPEVLNHTPAPKSYLGWHAWAERMSETHAQRRCPRCGFLAIWVPRSTEHVDSEGGQADG